MTEHFRARTYPHGVATLSSHADWRLLIVITVAILGLLILLLTLTRPTEAGVLTATPMVIRDGLIVKGSGPTLYLFKRYMLHQIVTPSESQQKLARRVKDDFLRQYSCGEPVNAAGQPLPETVVKDSAVCLAQGPLFISRLSPRWMMLLWLLGLAGLTALMWNGIGWVQQQQKSQLTYLQQGKLYTTQIERLLQANPDRQSGELLNQVNRWQQNLEELVQRLTNLQQNEAVYWDFATIPATIASLEQQAALETNLVLRTQLNQVISQRKNQLEVLEEWQSMLRQAEIQVEMTAALLGTVYSQLLTQQSTTHVTDYRRLTRQVGEEVARLQDYLEALQEVKRPAYEFA